MNSASMPLSLQYIGFWVSIISLLLTFLTFIATINVRKNIIHRQERETFKNNFNTIEGKFLGFINSIMEDKIYFSSGAESFQFNILQFLVDTETAFSFLSLRIKFKILFLKRTLKKSNLDAKTWKNVAQRLTVLKNLLRKEKSVL